MRELYDSIGTAANQSLVESRMAGCSDHEQLDFELFGKFNDVSHRVPGNDVRIKFDMAFFGHRACALQNVVKTPRGVIVASYDRAGEVKTGSFV